MAAGRFLKKGGENLPFLWSARGHCAAFGLRCNISYWIHGIFKKSKRKCKKGVARFVERPYKPPTAADGAGNDDESDGKTKS